MFTGLIEDIGIIVSKNQIPDGFGLRFGIKSELVARDINVGDSIAVDGVCLTVTDRQPSQLYAEAVEETLKRSTLGELKIGSNVNLERSLRFADRLGGHFVQGHVDGTGTINRITKTGSAVWLNIQIPEKFHRYIILKGSIAVDGISLTVAEKGQEHVEISIIPHTYETTTLQFKKEKDAVNIELDMMAKYIENLMAQNEKEEKSTISKEWLKEQGFS